MTWINTPNAVVNMEQVCRIEFRYTDIRISDEVDGFTLHFADGNALTVFYNECGFIEINAELEDNGFVLSLRSSQ